MFDYFTSQGVSNVIWLSPFATSPDIDYYPGRDWVDMAGSDLNTGINYTGVLFSAVTAIVGTTIPLALYENSLIPDPSGMFDASPPDKPSAPWVLFNTGQGLLIHTSNFAPNTLSHVINVYADPHVVTRDEVPDLN
jgi:mannan endo-1,4-beta-mannosidase